MVDHDHQDILQFSILTNCSAREMKDVKIKASRFSLPNGNLVDGKKCEGPQIYHILHRPL